MTGKWTPPNTLAIFIVYAFATNGIAQEQLKSKQAPLVGMIGLIVREPVLKELGIESDSTELIEIRELLRPFSAVLEQRMNHPTEKDRVSHLSAQELYANVEAEFVAELKRLLLPEQFARLRQIHWQQWGLRAIEDEELVALLGLTQDQIDQVATTRLAIDLLQNDLRKQQQELRRRGESMVEIKQKVQDLDAQRIKAYGEVLTSAQLEKLTELKGAVFDLVPSVPAVKTSSGMPSGIQPDGLITLALMQPVMNELRLDETSVEATEVRKLSRAYAREMRQELQARNTSLKGRERVRDIESNLQNKYNSELMQVLTESQFTRLRQIYWQRLGADALNDADVVNALTISKDQQLQIAALNLEVFKKVRELMNPTSNRVEGAVQTELRQKQVQDLVAQKDLLANQILSPTQLRKFRELKGKPFDLDLLRAKSNHSSGPKPAE